MATAAPPAEHERERAARRRGRGSRRVAVGAALLALAFLLALRQLGLLFPDHIVWPVMLAAAGVALIWRQWGGRGRPAPPPTTARSAATQAAPEPAVSDERAALRTLYRGGFGVALIVGAGLLFLYANGALSGLGDVALTALVAIVALGLILAPFWWRLGNALAAERAERIRSQERAEVAAHLHDSVLQTLALVQQRADDPKTVATLARRQERELRDWLRGRPPTAERESFSAALEAAAEEVEEAHGVRIDVVAVGDHPLDERAEALVAAAREALTNAAKFAGDAGPVSAYAEASPRRVQVFVRDRGPGFALDAVPPDRRGVRESIVGRMARHGGTATLHTAPGQGTEVELTLEDRECTRASSSSTTTSCSAPACAPSSPPTSRSSATPTASRAQCRRSSPPSPTSSCSTCTCRAAAGWRSSARWPRCGPSSASSPSRSPTPPTTSSPSSARAHAGT